MGQSLSQVVTANPSAKPELLEIERTMRDRLDCKKARLYIDALNDECIPIVCAVDKFDEFLGEVDQSRLEDEIEKILKKHLRSKDDLKKLIELLEEVLKAMLGSSQATHEEQQTHVVHANDSFIRIDYYLYLKKYGTSSDKFALFYYGQVGLIDVAKARMPVLVYELRRATKEDKLKDASEELKLLGELKLHSVDDAVKFLEKF